MEERKEENLGRKKIILSFGTKESIKNYMLIKMDTKLFIHD